MSDDQGDERSKMDLLADFKRQVADLREFAAAMVEQVDRLYATLLLLDDRDEPLDDIDLEAEEDAAINAAVGGDAETQAPPTPTA